LLRLRRIRPDGGRGEAVVVVPAGQPLANGFPQMVRAGSELVLAWTAGRVRTAIVPVPDLPRQAPATPTASSLPQSR
jgi:hypothetical protein